jgi:oligopeptide/dipeptide ABC transporter ATP-binding protein
MFEKRLIEVKGLKKYFRLSRGFLSGKTIVVHAVDGVDFIIHEGETLGLVGESGCGKTTVGRTILGLTKPDAGEVVFNGINIFSLGKNKLRALRANMAIVFQDAQSSFNPRMTVESIIGRPIEVYGLAKGLEKKHRVIELLRAVDLDPESLGRYPHEFSGGQQQRIGIARALTLNPKFIVLDEPTSALDVSVQAQILNLLRRLQKKYHLTYLFISHNLVVVKHISNRIAIMYLGKIVELAEKDELFNSPQHPYTKGLISAMPVPDPVYAKKRGLLRGDIPSSFAPPRGCRFHPRCKFRKPYCEEIEPELYDIGNRHFVACHLTSKKAVHENLKS